MATTVQFGQKPTHFRFVDLTGRKFARLTILGFVGQSPNKESRWLCECECGGQTVATSPHLTTGHTKSCGCHRREVLLRKTHGRRHTAEYSIWTGMWTRCTNPNEDCYCNYGQRGIVVCERWRSFEAFFADMGERPSPKHTIERKDNDGPYSSDNCIWATRTIQARNKRNTRFVTVNGVTKCLADWAESAGVNRVTIYCRLRRGESGERLLRKARA